MCTEKDLIQSLVTSSARDYNQWNPRKGIVLVPSASWECAVDMVSLFFSIDTFVILKQDGRAGDGRTRHSEFLTRNIRASSNKIVKTMLIFGRSGTRHYCISFRFQKYKAVRCLFIWMRRKRDPISESDIRFGIQKNHTMPPALSSYPSWERVIIWRSNVGRWNRWQWPRSPGRLNNFRVMVGIYSRLWEYWLMLWWFVLDILDLRFHRLTFMYMRCWDGVNSRNSSRNYRINPPTDCRRHVFCSEAEWVAARVSPLRSLKYRQLPEPSPLWVTGHKAVTCHCLMGQVVQLVRRVQFRRVPF